MSGIKIDKNKIKFQTYPKGALHTIIAFIDDAKIGELFFDSSSYKERVIWIDALHVCHNYRGKGVGSALMQNFIAAYGEDCELRLNVILFDQDKNNPMTEHDIMKFYSKFDFKFDKERTRAFPCMIRTATKIIMLGNQPNNLNQIKK